MNARLGIAELIDGEDPDTIPAARRPKPDPRRQVPTRHRATADSVFTVLGVPEKVITFKPYPTELYASFNIGQREMTVFDMPSEKFGPVLAHEMMHQASTAKSLNPQMQGLLNVFLEKFAGLPEEAQARHFDRLVGQGYYEPLETQADSTLQKMQKAGRWSAEMQEILGAVTEHSFELAREPDPSVRKLLVDDSEQMFPGTREVFNYITRMLQGMDK